VGVQFLLLVPSPSMIPNATVYVAVRMDIAVAQQLVQSCHAALNAGKHFGMGLPDGEPFVIVYGVSDLASLWALRDKATGKAIRTVGFEESDLGGELTAFATEPINKNKGNKIFWKERLWSPLQNAEVAQR
jgi:hypothetical protein